MSTEIDQAVAKLLMSHDVFAVTLTQENTYDLEDQESERPWWFDRWTVVLNGYAFEYKTGLGHRSKFTSAQYKKQRALGKTFLRANVVSVRLTGHESYDSYRYIEYIAVPTLASILNCIILDSSALDENFQDWADECGMSGDSIKALNIYNLCCDNGRRLRKALSRSQLKQATELLEGY